MIAGIVTSRVLRVERRALHQALVLVPNQVLAHVRQSSDGASVVGSGRGCGDVAHVCGVPEMSPVEFDKTDIHWSEPGADKGEDRWILSQFPDGYMGTAVELGALDGHYVSNTLLLEQKGLMEGLMVN